MTLAEKISYLMLKEGINRAELAKGSDIPYTTIVSIFEKGSDNTKLTTLKKLAKYFNVTLDFLVDETPEVEEEKCFSDKEIVSMAAKMIGFSGDITDREIQQVKMALKIALTKDV